MTEKQIDKWIGNGGIELDTWTWWNNCKEWNKELKAIETPDGEQFLVLYDELVMMSKPAEIGSWDIKIMTGHAFMESYVGFCDIKKWKLVEPRTLE